MTEGEVWDGGYGAEEFTPISDELYLLVKRNSSTNYIILESTIAKH